MENLNIDEEEVYEPGSTEVKKIKFYLKSDIIYFLNIFFLNKTLFNKKKKELISFLKRNFNALNE
jgi:hypothetical protein